MSTNWNTFNENKPLWKVVSCPEQSELLRQVLLKEKVSLRVAEDDEAKSQSIEVTIVTLRPESGNGSEGHWLLQTATGHSGYLNTNTRKGTIS